MNKLLRLTIAMTITLLYIIFDVITPVTATTNYIGLQNPFTIDPNQPGSTLQTGSTVYQLNGGTIVYDPEGVLLYKTLDSLCSSIHLACGKTLPSDQVYYLPSNCTIVHNKIGYNILKNEITVLNIVLSNVSILASAQDSSKVNYHNVSQLISSYGYGNDPQYIEQANDFNGSTGSAQGYPITDFNANFVVPDGPQNSGSMFQCFWIG
jgi:hypothetical protein